MDDTLDPLENKEKVLAHIDALHEEHRKQILHGIIDEHKQPYAFSFDETTSVEELICLVLQLSMRDPSIMLPGGLMFGEPYDSYFISSYHNLYVIRKLFRYADQLPMFLIYKLERLRGPFGYHKVLKEEIWEKMPMLSRGEPYRDIEQLQRAIRQSPLSKTEVIYLTLLMTVHLPVSCYEFIEIMERIS